MQSKFNRWLHVYAVFTAAATLVLICFGGLVTSHEAGLAVPDWPTSFGYNMFFFPFSQWVGGIFYEHTHRLVASVVGLLTVGLAIWLWRAEPRRYVRLLGGLSVFAVVFQGVLGGLRVTELKDELGIFHGALAQLFFVLMCSLALMTSKWWHTARQESRQGCRRSQFIAATAVILLQLLIGATMRHQHAGLAIADFPAAHGKLWPDTTPEAIALYNQTRSETTALKPITGFQIQLQMVHRIVALFILVAVGVVALNCWRRLGARNAVTRLALFWLSMILMQAMLGAATIWTNKSADIATAHVACGAASLATGALIALALYRMENHQIRADSRPLLQKAA